MGGPLSAVGVIQNDPGQLEGSKPVLKPRSDFLGSVYGCEIKEVGYIPEMDKAGGHQY